MDFPIPIFWVSPLSFLELQEWFFNFISFFDEIPLYRPNSPRWDAAFCGVTLGAILFAYVQDARLYELKA